MQDTRNNSTEINGGYWLRQRQVIKGVPIDCYSAYCKLLNSATAYYAKEIEAVFKSVGYKMQFPVDIKILERYFTGFVFEYQPFCNWLPTEDSHKEGFWERRDDFTFVIHYNECAPVGRQRYTIVHEILHICQFFDMQFMDFLDELILDTELPPSTIQRVYERTAEKTTALFLMPTNAFLDTYFEMVEQDSLSKSVLKGLASKWKVSAKSAYYRLKECGITLPEYDLLK